MESRCLLMVKLGQQVSSRGLFAAQVSSFGNVLFLHYIVIIPPWPGKRSSKDRMFILGLGNNFSICAEAKLVVVVVSDITFLSWEYTFSGGKSGGCIQDKVIYYGVMGGKTGNV